jgi:hypothetical protein
MKEFSQLTPEFSMPQKGNRNNDSENDKSIQDILEKLLRDFVLHGGIETVYLLDEEGLSLTRYPKSKALGEADAVEITQMMYEARKIAMNSLGTSRVREIFIETHERRKIVFRFMTFFDQVVTLVFIVPARKPYRGLTNRLQREIQKLEKRTD